MLWKGYIESIERDSVDCRCFARDAIVIHRVHTVGRDVHLEK